MDFFGVWRRVLPRRWFSLFKNGFPAVFPTGFIQLAVTVFNFVIGCFAGTYAAPPTDTEMLKKFYTTVSPWGFWKPVHALVVAEDPAL